MTNNKSLVSYKLYYFDINSKVLDTFEESAHQL